MMYITKIVINTTYGGSFFPYQVILRFAELSNLRINPYTNIKDIDNPNESSSYDFENYYRVEESDIIKHEIFHDIIWLYNDEEIINFNDFDDIFTIYSVKRDNEFLIQAFEENIELAQKYGFKFIEIPDDVEWYIEQDDSGREWVAEEHRTWS